MRRLQKWWTDFNAAESPKARIAREEADRELAARREREAANWKKADEAMSQTSAIFSKWERS